MNLVTRTGQLFYLRGILVKHAFVHVTTSSSMKHYRHVSLFWLHIVSADELQPVCVAFTLKHKVQHLHGYDPGSMGDTPDSVESNMFCCLEAQL